MEVEGGGTREKRGRRMIKRKILKGESLCSTHKTKLIVPKLKF